MNSAMLIEMDGDLVKYAGISAGGIGPIPMHLKKSCEYLIGKSITPDIINEVINIAKTEISPISDIRGSMEYKSLLLKNLIYSHFLTLFPELSFEEVVL